jgi:predicted methyltransferase
MRFGVWPGAGSFTRVLSFGFSRTGVEVEEYMKKFMTFAGRQYGLSPHDAIPSAFL